MHHSAESLDTFGAYYLHPFDAAMFTGWYGHREFSDGPVMKSQRAQHTATLTTHWWDHTYTKRQQITVSTGAAVDVGYVVSTDIDVSALVAGGEVQADLDDWRIAFCLGRASQ